MTDLVQFGSSPCMSDCTIHYAVNHLAVRDLMPPAEPLPIAGSLARERRCLWTIERVNECV